MQGIRTLFVLAVSGIFASHGVASAVAVPAGTFRNSGAVASPATAALPQDAARYPGLMPLVNAHRAEQVKMVKLWKTIKDGKGTDKTPEEYKEAQIRVQKASNKVDEYIANDKWSVEDRVAMHKVWAAELEKPIE